MINKTFTYYELFALSDIEIAKLIAQIKELTVYEQSGLLRVVQDGDDYYFDPVNDKALCVNLMDEFDVERIHEPYDCLGFHTHCINDDNPVRILEIDSSRKVEHVSISLTKAVSLAIVKAKFFNPN
jgi:hypothetical protein